MVILTSFSQIKEVDTEMKTAQRDQVNEEEYKPDIVKFVRFLYWFLLLQQDILYYYIYNFILKNPSLKPYIKL